MVAEHEHTNMLVEWMIDHAPGVVIVLSTVAGGIYWWMCKVFTTKDNTESCKIELLAAMKLEKEQARETLKEYHEEHKADMQVLRNETSFVRRELAEFKNLLIGYSKGAHL